MRRNIGFYVTHKASGQRIFLEKRIQVGSLVLLGRWLDDAGYVEDGCDTFSRRFEGCCAGGTVTKPPPVRLEGASLRGPFRFV